MTTLSAVIAKIILATLRDSSLSQSSKQKK
jgi:hypothetical protein